MDSTDQEAAFDKGLRILTVAGQTRLGLSRKLARAGFTESTVALAVQRLTEWGYINDRAFATSTLMRRRRSGRGVRLVASELRYKGIDAEIVGELLGSIDYDEELVRASALAGKLAARRSGEAPAEQRDHVLAALVRRGYSPQIARRAWEQVAAEISG